MFWRSVVVIIDSLAWLSGLLLCTLAGLICFDVAARNLQWFAFRWTLDLAEYHLYLITFLAAPWVLKEHGHIAVDLVLNAVPDNARRYLYRLSAILGAGVCLVLFGYSLKVLWASYTANTFIYKSLIMPEWPLFLVPPITFLLLFIVFAHRCINLPAVPSRTDSDGI